MIWVFTTLRYILNILLSNQISIQYEYINMIIFEDSEVVQSRTQIEIVINRTVHYTRKKVNCTFFSFFNEFQLEVVKIPKT